MQQQSHKLNQRLLTRKKWQRNEKYLPVFSPIVPIVLLRQIAIGISTEKSKSDKDISPPKYGSFFLVQSQYLENEIL